jgi:hypothetical protein
MEHNQQQHQSDNTKPHRGRSAIHAVDPVAPSKPPIPQVMKREASRPVKAGTGRHRGDRRDMSKTYSGTKDHSSRGSDVRPDVTTRKR